MVALSQAVDAVVERNGRRGRRPIEPGSHLWDDVGLITFTLTSGSAFLLQTMHPAIGTVVGEHSVYRTDGIGRALRSIASVQTWIYGGDEGLAEGDRLRVMHKTLNSTGEDGTRYSALASGPWAWVPLTGPFAYATAAQYFSRRPYSADELEALYQEVVQLMRNLHVAEKEIPATYSEYLDKFDEILDNTLVPHQTAYEFLETTRKLPPPVQLPGPLRPLWRVLAFGPGRLQHFVIVGTTPEKAREKLGLEWSATDERALQLIGWAISRTVPLLPERIRYFPIAYQARKAHRERETLRRMLAHRPM
jgi:uncharacterized protein (DUF2236 family)